jgi:flagellar hook-associated protein 2
MAISSPGIGSNLDVNGIVSQLMAIERQPLNKIDTQEASFQTKLSAVGSLKGVLSSLQSSLAALTKPATFAGSFKASSSASDFVTASASDKASSGSFSVSVQQLAQAQKLRTANTFASVNSAFGSGKITIQFGTATPNATDPTPDQLTLPGTFAANGDKAATTITIDPAKNTLLDVRDAINKASAGVTATIVNDGTGFRLAISSNDPGAANGLKITVETATPAIPMRPACPNWPSTRPARRRAIFLFPKPRGTPCSLLTASRSSSLPIRSAMRSKA